MDNFVVRPDLQGAKIRLRLRLRLTEVPPRTMLAAMGHPELAASAMLDLSATLAASILPPDSPPWLALPRIADLLASLLLQGEVGAERERRMARIVRWKPPELSKAQNVTTPSWLYLEAIQTSEPTPDGQRVKLEDYQEHLSWCRENVDPRLYVREPVVASSQAVEEYRWEIIGVARKIAASIVASVKADSPERLAVAFPRTPLCRKPGGSCPFVSLCAGGDPQEARSEFTTSEGLRWERPGASKLATSKDGPSPSDDLGF